MLRIAPALFAAALASGQPFGDHLVLTPGTSSFTVPEKTLSVSLLCIGAGGAGAFNAREVRVRVREGVRVGVRACE